mgnify:FL=1
MKINITTWSEESMQATIEINLDEMKYIRDKEYDTWKIITRAIELSCSEISKSVQIK